MKLNNSLRIRVRVAETGQSQSGRIGIHIPLVDNQTREKIVDEFSFGKIDTPAGYFPFLVSGLIVAHLIFLCNIDWRRIFG